MSMVSSGPTVIVTYPPGLDVVLPLQKFNEVLYKNEAHEILSLFES